MRRLVILALLILIAAACGNGTEAQEYAHPEALASAAWLMDHLYDSSVRILDGRAWGGGGERDYAAGHIPGAVYVDVWSDLSDPHGAT